MGASGWHYYAAYDDDLSVVLAELHRSVLESRDYYWGGDDEDRPSTFAELTEMFEDEDFEDVASEGTHSILDIDQMLPAGSPDDFGAVVALSPDEVVTAFGSSTPTRAQFDEVYRNGQDLIADFPRWSGRFTTLYEEARPTALVFWGYSGD